MNRILLIRHGHTELVGKVLYGRMSGVHLSHRGKQDVGRLANGLSGQYKINAVVSSPLDRARETAESIAAVLGLDVLFDNDLQELDYGEWMGRPFEDLTADSLWKLYNVSRSLACPPGGEFIMQVQARAWSAVQRAVQPFRGEAESTIALVSHGDVVRGLLMLFLGMPVDFIHRLEIGTASVSEVVLGASQPQVITINRTF